jgi:hypothetical protein
MTMSLDDFINDRNGGVGSLYPDLSELRKIEMLQELIKTTGAVVIRLQNDRGKLHELRVSSADI